MAKVNSKLKERIDELERECKSLERRNQELRNELCNAEDSYSDLNDHCEMLSSKVSQQEHLIWRLQSQVSYLLDPDSPSALQWDGIEKHQGVVCEMEIKEETY